MEWSKIATRRCTDCYAFGKRYKDAEGRDPNAEEYLGLACKLKL